MIFDRLFTVCRLKNLSGELHSFQKNFFERVATLLFKIFLIISPFLFVVVPAENLYAAGALSLTLTPTNVTCNGGNNGSITSSLAGGSGGSVNYTLTPGGITNTTGVFTNLSAGSYTVTADDSGTTTTASATITEPPVSSIPSVTLGASSTLCPGVPNFSLNYVSTNGSPVSYSISAGTPAMTGFVPVVDAPWGTSPLTIPLPAGVPKGTYQFIITVKNAAGCPSAAQTFNQNFDDTAKPTFTAPGAITVYTDLSCKVNTSPSITGNVTALSDNCAAVSDLIVTHVDGAPVPVGGSCNLPYVITRIWRVTDPAGNYDEKTQLITVNDNIKPNLTLPPDIALSCDQSTLPTTTGTATATDNCSPTTISYSDSQVFGSCGGNSVITRTWTATDCSGNAASGTQRITVTDNTKPVATAPNKSVGCPADIPTPYVDLAAFIADGGTATDNCGALILSLFNEISNGLEGKPGYCPTSVTRVYRISDPCGNYTDVVQTISVLGECGCSKCVAGTNFHSIDLSGKPTGSVTISNQQRNGACCVESNCISFNVQLDVDAIGVEILVDGATPSPQDWRIDCNSIAINGNLVCMPGGSFHLFTYCKPGANKNDFTFRSVPGVIVGSGNITTRVDCNVQLSASGFTGIPEWNSISPGVKGQYNSYLSSTSVANPVFTADVNSPPVIQYEVCGNIGSSLCNALGTDCAVATVNVMQKIGLTWNTNPAMVCLGNMPTLTANVSPAANYSYDWYNGHGATGTIVYSGSASYKPSAAGPYSLKVTDISSGIACNTAIFDFDVVIDNIGPSVFAPPQPLSVQCGDPAAPQQITNWLATASASYTKLDGTVVNLVPSNDYTGITMACNTIVNVTFSAADQCGNITSTTSTITVIDTQPPVFTFCPANITVNVDPNQCYASGVTLGTATATDICSTPTITNDAPAQLPVGTNLITWTATDACGNKTTCTQTVTVKDDIKPVLTCPADVVQTALPGNCSLSNVTITGLAATDNCAIVTQTWTMSGATTGSSLATGINPLSGLTFNVGVTTVTSTVADAAGNTATCTFSVWTKDLNKPVLTSGCPSDVTQPADAGQCSAVVTIPKLVVTDPCNEGYTVINSFNNTDDASGTYPVGVTTVNWTITDASGNVTTCTQKVTVNDLQYPTLVCPANVTQTALPGNCSLANVTIQDPSATDNCKVVTQTWKMSGATTGSSPVTGINSVSGQTFNVGVTTVTYTVADAAGNTATCSFSVWIKDLVKPVLTSGCPPDVTQAADAGQCSAVVTIPKPAVSDPCNEGYTVINSFNNTDDASGTYPVGVTNVNWTITDASGNVTTCIQKVTITDQPPSLTCPANISVLADFEKLFASNVAVPSPVYGDDCPGLTLTWSMTGVTTGSSSATGVNIFPSPYTFNQGITTIQYTLTDANGHSVNCSFTVSVLSKPVIKCQPDMTKNNDPGLCSASLDPGFPVTLAGGLPITYTWSMSGATPASGTATGTGTITPNPYTFNVGVTTITWTATNAAGSDQCSQVITVVDKEPPAIIAPAPFSFCVEDMISASMVSNLLQINPAPDYFLFKKGSTALDVNPANFSDNCTPANQLELHWTIDFSSSTPTPSISGTGQPSAYPSDITFPGDGVTFKDVTHTITYWVVDPSGNESVHKAVTITIHPRPAVTYRNQNNNQFILHTNLKKLNYEKNRTRKLFE